MLYDDYDCGNFNIRRGYFWYCDMEGWGVYYAPDCFAAIEVFETFTEAWAFAQGRR